MAFIVIESAPDGLGTLIVHGDKAGKTIDTEEKARRIAHRLRKERNNDHIDWFPVTATQRFIAS